MWTIGRGENIAEGSIEALAQSVGGHVANVNGPARVAAGGLSEDDQRSRSALASAERNLAALPCEHLGPILLRRKRC